MATYDPYNEEIIGLRQKQALAQKLRENAMQPEEGKMISGWYVPASPWSTIAKGLQAYKANNLENQAEERIKQIGEEQTAKRNAWMSEMPTTTTRQVGMEGSETGTVPVQQKPTAEQYLGWATRGMTIDPAVAQMGMSYANLAENRAARESELRMRLMDASLSREQREEANRQLEKQRAADRESQIRLMAALRPPKEEKPLTEFQGKSSTFGTRAAQAHNILNNLEENVNPLAVVASQKGGMLTNWAISPEAQSVAQAQSNFINAVLRQESGASISASEFENAKKQYFPQAGDTPEVIAQKRDNRKLVIEGFARQAGPAGKDVAEVYNAGAPMIPKAQQNNPNLPSPNSIAAEIERRAKARGQ